MRFRKFRQYKYVSVSMTLFLIWMWLLYITGRTTEQWGLASSEEILVDTDTRSAILRSTNLNNLQTKCNCSRPVQDFHTISPTITVKRPAGVEIMPATLLPPEIIADKFKPLLSAPEKQLLYDTLLKVAQIATEHNIQYWIYSGTLLGAFRHEDFVPWDDDADVIVNDTQRREFLDAMSSAYPKFGFVLAGSRIKVFRHDAWKVNKEHVHWKWPYVDVSFFRENATHVWDHSDDQEYGDRLYIYSKKSTFPLRRIPLGPFWAEAPKDIWAHLKETYPMGIYTCVSPMYHHRTETPVNDVIRISCRILYKILKKQLGFDVPRDVIYNSNALINFRQNDNVI